MSWEALAAQLLTAAAADVTVAREVIAPGPGFARDCRMVAVHLDRTTSEILGYCAVLPKIVLQVTFAADCVPMPSDSGAPPTPEAITTWAEAFLADVEKVHAGILAFADQCAAGDCERVTVGDGIPSGPLGGISTFAWPVEIRLT